jgi:hypothetical protein
MTAILIVVLGGKCLIRQKRDPQKSTPAGRIGNPSRRIARSGDGAFVP